MPPKSTACGGEFGGNLVKAIVLTNFIRVFAVRHLGGNLFPIFQDEFSAVENYS